jgi:hypothetical protein
LADSTTPEIAAPIAEDVCAVAVSTMEETEAAEEMQLPSGNQSEAATTPDRRVNLVQRVRDWLRRAA